MLARPRILLAMLAVLFVAGRAPAGTSLAVIVHPSRSVTLSTADLAQIYLKKRRFWSDGRPIIPINREAASNTRATFSQAVFGRKIDRMAMYWNRLYFQGVLPPATLASTAAVKRFVAAEPNAIGYIEADQVDDSVRALLHLD